MTDTKVKPQVLQREFESEHEVAQHFAQLINSAKRDLTGKISDVVVSTKSKYTSYSYITVLILGALALGISWMTISAIITGALGLSILAGTGLIAVYLRFKYPSWVADLRAKQVVTLARIQYEKELALIEQKNAYINSIREKAANDPIATRRRVANEMAQEIDDGEDVASRFEGMLKTQENKIAKAKKDFPDNSFADAEETQREMSEALVTMRTDLNRARGELEQYNHRTSLIETQLELAAGALSMAEFMQKDTSKEQIRKIESDIATESAELSFQEARAALRSSAMAAKRRITQSQQKGA